MVQEGKRIWKRTKKADNISFQTSILPYENYYLYFQIHQEKHLLFSECCIWS